VLKGLTSDIGADKKTRESTMKKVREITELQEPLGIIISSGDRLERRPIFSAYIWGPAPEPTVEVTAKVA
jgi:hypothetical protein